MTWNYRIIRHPERGGYFALHEVFYSDEGTSWTSQPITFVCDLDEGSDGIVNSLEMALRDAIKHPVLELTPDGKLLVNKP